MSRAKDLYKELWTLEEAADEIETNNEISVSVENGAYDLVLNLSQEASQGLVKQLRKEAKEKEHELYQLFK